VWNTPKNRQKDAIEWVNKAIQRVLPGFPSIVSMWRVFFSPIFFDRFEVSLGCPGWHKRCFLGVVFSALQNGRKYDHYEPHDMLSADLRIRVTHAVTLCEIVRGIIHVGGGQTKEDRANAAAPEAKGTLIFSRAYKLMSSLELKRPFDRNEGICWIHRTSSLDRNIRYRCARDSVYFNSTEPSHSALKCRFHMFNC